MTRLLAAGRYGFDSLSVGDRVETGSAEITAEKINAFADLTGDLVSCLRSLIGQCFNFL